MNREQILRDLMALPPMAQRLVADFIAFLRLRYAQEPSEEIEALPALKNEPFMRPSRVWDMVLGPLQRPDDAEAGAKRSHGQPADVVAGQL